MSQILYFGAEDEVFLTMLPDEVLLGAAVSSSSPADAAFLMSRYVGIKSSKFISRNHTCHSRAAFLQRTMQQQIGIFPLLV